MGWRSTQRGRGGRCPGPQTERPAAGRSAAAADDDDVDDDDDDDNDDGPAETRGVAEFWATGGRGRGCARGKQTAPPTLTHRVPPVLPRGHAPLSHALEKI